VVGAGERVSARAAVEVRRRSIETKKAPATDGRMVIYGIDHSAHVGHAHAAWKKIREGAGLAGLRLHDLRHTAITRLQMTPGISDATILALVGHTDLSQTRRYTHIGDDAKLAAIEAAALAAEAVSNRALATNLPHRPASAPTLH
jgi:integrase